MRLRSGHERTLLALIIMLVAILAYVASQTLISHP
jgi:hypothetical protein